MKLSVKIALCVLLVLFAAASALAVLADLGALPTQQSAGLPAAGTPAYELRTWEDGRVALFSPPGSVEPVGLTEITAGQLPLVDQLALADGIRLEDYESVVRLVEDLGG